MAKRRRRARSPRRIALALAGGGPFGAIYETGVLMALAESLEGLDLNEIDVYVGVSAGGFLAAGLANGIPVSRIHALFVEGRRAEGALTAETFMRPALGEYVRRLALVPALLAESAWRFARRPLATGAWEALSPLGRAIPTGLFDNEAIHDALAEVFSREGRTNDFRKLRRRLYLVATDLDSGDSVTFGREGHDQVPISRAVQASAALPGLFPPVEIGGRFYVDGALKKTLHASEALADGATLVICVNPIVPHDARVAAERGRSRRERLVEGGLPVVLSQTFRALIHSRMAVGLSRYRTQYPHADVVLFEPEAEDAEVFFANVFGFAAASRLCRHAYARTRLDLLRRRAEIEPVLARHGIRMRRDVLQEPGRLDLGLGRSRFASRTLPDTAEELRSALMDLRRSLAGEGLRSGA